MSEIHIDIGDTVASDLTEAAAAAEEYGIAPMHNAALGLPVEQMNIVVIDPSRTMQTILRSMLQQMRPKRLRVHDSAISALRDMVVEPPNLVISEWKMDHMSGHGLIKIMRHKSMHPLCAVPVIVVTGSATRSAVESALRIGAHSVLVKPLSPAMLRKRIDWISQDRRPMVLSGDQYIIDGVQSALDAQRAKDRLPSIIDQITMHKSSAAKSPDEVVSQPRDNVSASEDMGDASPTPARAKGVRKLERSPTLDRLLRQRAQLGDVNAERERAARQVSREKIELASSKRKKNGTVRGRWKDLWKS